MQTWTRARVNEQPGIKIHERSREPKKLSFGEIEKKMI